MCSAESRCAGFESLSTSTPAASISERNRTEPSPAAKAPSSCSDGKLRAISPGAGRPAPTARGTGIERGEDLAAAGVDDGKARPAGGLRQLGERGGEGARRQDSDDRDLARLSECARGRDPDPQPGERAGPEADGDPVDPLPPAGGADRILDRSQ